MKTLGAAFVTALIVFTLATVWMDYVQPRLEILANASAAKSGKVLTTGAAKRSSRGGSPNDDGEDISNESMPPVAAKSRKRSKAAEEAAAMEAANERYMSQLEELKKREAKLNEREEAINAIYAEIKREVAKVEENRRRSMSELALVETRLSEKQPDEQASSVKNAATKAKAKSTSDARIAAVVRDLANRGNIKDAASFLSGFEDRDAARILSSLSTTNPAIALRLSDQIRTAKLQKGSGPQ